MVSGWGGPGLWKELNHENDLDLEQIDRAEGS